MNFNLTIARPLICALALSGGAGVAIAQSKSVVASRDTFLSEHPNWGGPTSVNGQRDFLHSVYGFTNGSGQWRTFPLIAFDLSEFEGRKVDQNQAVELRMLLTQSNVKSPQAITVSTMLVDWSETATSFANLGGMGFNALTHVGEKLLETSVAWHGSPELVSFSLPGSIIQTWIDNPGKNYGVIFMSAPSPDLPDDKAFSSREGTIAPNLTFTLAVPEVSSLYLMLTGVVGLLAFLKRRATA